MSEGTAIRFFGSMLFWGERIMHGSRLAIPQIAGFATIMDEPAVELEIALPVFEMGRQSRDPS